MKVRGGLGVPEMSRKKGYGKRHVFLEGSIIEVPIVVYFCCKDVVIR